MAQTDNFEREVEETRKRLAATLDELRGRLTPASLGREVLGVARRSTAARFATNLGNDANDKAVPLIGMAASIAWMMLSKRSQVGGGSSPGSYFHARDTVGRVVNAGVGLASSLGRTAAAATSSARGAAHSISRTASTAAERISSTSTAAVASTRSASDQMQQGLTSAAQRTKQGGQAVAGAVSSATKQTSLTAGTAFKLTRKDPVFAAGLGLTVAGIAAAAYAWSRRAADARPVSDLAAAAKGERGAYEGTPLSSVPPGEASIVPPVATARGAYGRDLTGAADRADGSSGP